MMSVTNSASGTKCVLVVSTSYPADSADWRGLFIRDLVKGLARRNDVDLRLWSPPGEIPENSQYVATAEEARWLTEIVAAGGIAHKLRSGGIRGLGAPLRLLRMLGNLYRREAGIDIYHVNWLQNALALPHNTTPLLTTVLGTDMQLLKLPGMSFFLRRVFRDRPVIICPNAAWMVPDLTQRFGEFARIQYVPFGIEPRWFALERKPRSRRARGYVFHA